MTDGPRRAQFAPLAENLSPLRNWTSSNSPILNIAPLSAAYSADGAAERHRGSVRISDIRRRADGVEFVQLRPARPVEIKILRRVRAESSRRPPRHRRDACSMAWRCRFITLDRASAASSMHPTHWLISTQRSTHRRGVSFARVSAPGSNNGVDAVRSHGPPEFVTG